MNFLDYHRIFLTPADHQTAARCTRLAHIPGFLFKSDAISQGQLPSDSSRTSFHWLLWTCFLCRPLRDWFVGYLVILFLLARLITEMSYYKS